MIFSNAIFVLILICRMSHGNATPEDARRVAQWIDQEAQTRIGIRACVADLRRERDRVVAAFKKIQDDRKKTKEQRLDFESTKRNQQQQCDRLHNILDGMIRQFHILIYQPYYSNILLLYCLSIYH